MLIKSAGYLWHRKHVDWGRGRELLGVPEQGKRNNENFADQSAIYGLYDANHQCIYIGQAGRGDSGLYDRLKCHAIDDHLFCFWERFTWFGFYSAEEIRAKNFDYIPAPMTLLEALNTIESIATNLALPRFNLSGSNSPPLGARTYCCCLWL